jgi:hypothetical protein
MDESDPPGVAEFVEYCRTQAALLSGRIERMGEEADALLDEVDDELATLRGDLDEATEGTPTPPSTAGPDHPTGDADGDEPAAAAESAVSAVERKQALVQAKQARMDAFTDLAAEYTELAESLQGTDDPSAALARVVEFEADHDAPSYFPDRETLAETVADEE